MAEKKAAGIKRKKIAGVEEPAIEHVADAVSDVEMGPDGEDLIYIKGARMHNLKNVDVAIPRNKLVVVTGVSGSGKSSLTMDTLFAEGQRRYAESLSAYARQFLMRMDKPDVDYIRGICPAIAIEQKVTTRTPRSTVGSMTEIYDYLRLLFARIGHTYSPVSGREVKKGHGNRCGGICKGTAHGYEGAADSATCNPLWPQPRGGTEYTDAKRL